MGFGCVFLNSLPGMWVTSHVKAGTSHAMVVLLLFFAIGMMVTPVVIGAALGWGDLEVGLHLRGRPVVSLAVVLTVRPVSDIAGRENLRWGQIRDVVGFNPRSSGRCSWPPSSTSGRSSSSTCGWPSSRSMSSAASKAVASLAVALFWAGLIIGRLIVIWLTKRYLASRLLLVGTAIMAVFALGMALSNSVAMSMVMAFFSGFGASAAFPLSSVSPGVPRLARRGGLFGRGHGGRRWGASIFPYLVGPIADSLGFRLAMGLAFVLAAALSLLALALHRVVGRGRDGRLEAAICDALALPGGAAVRRAPVRPV